ncbi:MAG: tetratricopeptide repeat protein [Thermomicrobiales bacterium]
MARTGDPLARRHRADQSRQHAAPTGRSRPGRPPARGEPGPLPRAGQPLGLRPAINNLGRCRWSQGARARAGELHEESLALARAIDNTVAIVNALTELSKVAQATGDPNRARALIRECVARCLDSGTHSLLPARSNGWPPSRPTMGHRRPPRASSGPPPPNATASAHPCRQASATTTQTHAALRTTLGETAYAAALLAGRALDPISAANAALADMP